jgi:serine/threonine protein kinase
MTNVEVKFDDDNTPNPEVEREKRQRIKRAELSCIRDFLTEAIIMSQFDHPNIVKFIGITFEKNYRFIVTELLSGGDLKEFLRKNRPSAVCTNISMCSSRNIFIWLSILPSYLQFIIKNYSYYKYSYFIQYIFNRKLQL